MSNLSSASYLPEGIASTLQNLELAITEFLATLLQSLPPAVQSYLLSIQSSPYLTRSNLQYALRLIVIISTYLLFRPHLEALFRRATGTPDARREELQNRLKFLQDLKEGKIKPQGGVEVVDGKVVLRPNPVRKDAKGTGKGKVVKLVVPGDDAEGDDGKGGGAGAQSPTKKKKNKRESGASTKSSTSTATPTTPNTRASMRRRNA